LALTIFAVLFAALEVGSYTQKSATWDEPVHMADGYASLVQHDYRIDPEHPPFLRMWAALPLLAMHVTPFDFSDVDRTPPRSWAWTLYSFCERFLYASNDADRLLYASRFMTVLLGIGLGVMLFAWAHEWLGFWPAAAALALYTVEPNIAAHASLVTTDFGLACFMFGTLYFLWRTCRRMTALNVTAFVLFFALAIVSKFSALVLIPAVAFVLAGAALRRQVLNPARALALFGVVGVAAWIAVWAVYGFRYAPSSSGTWFYDFQADPMVRDRVPTLASLIGWVDRHHLLPNVFSEGFLFGQAKAQVRPAFLFGSFSDQGWWYYFPLAFLVKTPVATLAFIAAGLIAVITAVHYVLKARFEASHARHTSNAVLAFWLAYILTRPLGASLGDYLSQPSPDGGLALGTVVTSAIFLGAILALVSYLTVTHTDEIPAGEAATVAEPATDAVAAPPA